jgi:hypothetical protein
MKNEPVYTYEYQKKYGNKTYTFIFEDGDKPLEHLFKVMVEHKIISLD